jgi:hypothetical protein
MVDKVVTAPHLLKLEAQCSNSLMEGLYVLIRLRPTVAETGQFRFQPLQLLVLDRHRALENPILLRRLPVYHQPSESGIIDKGSYKPAGPHLLQLGVGRPEVPLQNVILVRQGLSWVAETTGPELRPVSRHAPIFVRTISLPGTEPHSHVPVGRALEALPGVRLGVGCWCGLGRGMGRLELHGRSSFHGRWLGTEGSPHVRTAGHPQP